MRTLVVVLVAFAGLAPAQESLVPDPLPTLEQLVRAARARYAEAPLQFRAAYRTEVRLATGEVRGSELYASTAGRFEVRGPRDFRIANDVRFGPFRNVFLTQVHGKDVVTRLERFDVSGAEPQLVDTLFRAVSLEDLEYACSLKLVGYVLCLVPDPPRFLEVAARRYPGLVVTAVDEQHVVLEALLRTEDVPTAERSAKPYKVRVVLGVHDAVLRELAVTFEDGGVYTRHTLSSVKVEKLEEPFEPLVVPEGAEVQRIERR